MSRTMVKVRHSRKRRKCDACLQTIEIGELYEDARIPPGGDMGNTTWWRSVSHPGEYTR